MQDSITIDSSGPWDGPHPGLATAGLRYTLRCWAEDHAALLCQITSTSLFHADMQTWKGLHT